jgi:hypothetical protein
MVSLNLTKSSGPNNIKHTKYGHLFRRKKETIDQQEFYLLIPYNLNYLSLS